MVLMVNFIKHIVSILDKRGLQAEPSIPGCLWPWLTLVNTPYHKLHNTPILGLWCSVPWCQVLAGGRAPDTRHQSVGVKYHQLSPIWSYGPERWSYHGVLLATIRAGGGVKCYFPLSPSPWTLARMTRAGVVSCVHHCLLWGMAAQS